MQFPSEKPRLHRLQLQLQLRTQRSDSAIEKIPQLQPLQVPVETETMEWWVQVQLAQMSRRHSTTPEDRFALLRVESDSTTQLPKGKPPKKQVLEVPQLLLTEECT